MKYIPLTQGKFAVIDDDDFERVNQYKWYAHKDRRTWYAQRTIDHSKGSCRKSHLHRFILGLIEGDPRIDHVDCNGLNNQKSNLRIATHQQNSFNQRSAKNSLSKFKGVSWHKKTCKWQARIGFDGILYWLGYSNSEIELARRYDAKARELFGEFAYLNFPLEIKVG